jgi:hypothetical protein
MSDEQKALHVNPVGENWEVESDAATLGQAASKPEAVELAKELATAEGASVIAVHTSDGQVDEQIDCRNKTPGKE